MDESALEDWILWCAREIREDLGIRAAQVELSIFELLVLRALVREKAAAPATLARAVGCSRSQMTMTTRRLERAGLVDARRDAYTQKCRSLEITDAGRAVHALAMKESAPRLAFLRALPLAEVFTGEQPVGEGVSG